MFMMGDRKGFELLNMILSEGSLEILEIAKDSEPKHFTDFRELVNSRTGKVFSPNTISTRLKELVEVGALERIITKTKRERDVVGYKITPAGLKALETSYRYEEELQSCFRKWN
ncbi:DNA-binding transcriptional regulator, HxlR family [Candidatus Methanophagaceae archaeon]|nr:DNA-binding transcriptional regulator, HxlR family [Methanophagales archaeon]